MVSKQAQKSIKQFRRFAKILSALYRSPNEMTNWRIKLFRWLVDLQGIFGPKVKGTNKETRRKTWKQLENQWNFKGAPLPVQPPRNMWEL